MKSAFVKLTLIEDEPIRIAWKNIAEISRGVGGTVPGIHVFTHVCMDAAFSACQAEHGRKIYSVKETHEEVDRLVSVAAGLEQ